MADESDDQTSGDSSDGETEDTVESLAQRAQEMLRRISAEGTGGTGATGKIVGAAGGLSAARPEGEDAAQSQAADDVEESGGGAAVAEPASPSQDPDVESSTTIETGRAPADEPAAGEAPAGERTDLTGGLTGKVADAVSGLRGSPGATAGGAIAGAAAGSMVGDSELSEPVRGGPVSDEPPPAEPPPAAEPSPAEPAAAAVGTAATTLSGTGSGGPSTPRPPSAESRYGDDDDVLFPELPIPGGWQVVILGLLIAAFFFLGGPIWDALFGGDEDSTDRVTETRSLFDSPTTTNPPTNTSQAVLAQAQTSTTEAEAEETTTTTTEASTTTTTTEASTTTESTTTEAPETTASAAAYTLFDALRQTGDTGTFADLVENVGLREELADVGAGERTLFAPSDEAMAQIAGAQATDLTSGPEAAEALIRYHIVTQIISAADLEAAEGTDLETASGLPLTVTTDGSDVILGGDSTVVVADIETDNGVVHVIDLILDPPTVNELIDLSNIEFEVNSDVITEAGQGELARAVEFFTQNPSISAAIEGHTDTDGSSLGNQELSERRAESVKTFLVEAGLDGDRFTTAGFGETRPILDQNGVEDKVASRRIEFVVR